MLSPEKNIYFCRKFKPRNAHPNEGKKGKIEYEILSPKKINKTDDFLVLNDPENFYRLYSVKFAEFIKQVYSQNNIFEVDVIFFEKLADKLIQQGDFQKGQFSLEAALQVENNPDVRFRLLNKLSFCYFKLGKMGEHKLIMRKVGRTLRGNPAHLNLFDVFPERGF